MIAPRAHVRLLPLALALACADHRGDKNLTNPTTAGDGFLGSAIITVGPGTGVLDGIDPGTGPAAVADGWTVRFDKFVVAIGDFDGDGLTDPGVHVVDLFALPDPSYIFATIDRVAPRAVESVALRLSVPTEDATSIEDFSVDRDLMIKNGWSLFISGTLTNPAGQSCLPDDPADCVTTEKIAFEWGLDAGVSLTDCATLNGEGFTILENDTTEVPIVFHGDRLFATNFSGSSSELRAQWVADADIDRDGTATADELRKVAAADLFGPEYDLTGAPRPVVTAHDFFVAQALAGIGYRGDGSCTARVEQ